MAIEALLDRLAGLKQTGTGKWTARCPAHEDRSPSLSLKDDGGTILIHCFAGCEVSDILGAMGLEMTDLFPPNVGTYESDGKPLKLGGITFTAADALRCLTYEAGVVLLLAADLADGKCLTPDENDRLLTCVERLTEAAVYTASL